MKHKLLIISLSCMFIVILNLIVAYVILTRPVRIGSALVPNNPLGPANVFPPSRADVMQKELELRGYTVLEDDYRTMPMNGVTGPRCIIDVYRSCLWTQNEDARSLDQFIEAANLLNVTTVYRNGYDFEILYTDYHCWYSDQLHEVLNDRSCGGTYAMIITLSVWDY